MQRPAPDGSQASKSAGNGCFPWPQWLHGPGCSPATSTGSEDVQSLLSPAPELEDTGGPLDPGRATAVPTSGPVRSDHGHGTEPVCSGRVSRDDSQRIDRGTYGLVFEAAGDGRLQVRASNEVSSLV